MVYTIHSISKMYGKHLKLFIMSISEFNRYANRNTNRLKKDIREVHKKLGTIFELVDINCKDCKSCCCRSCGDSNGYWFESYGCDGVVYNLFKDMIDKRFRNTTGFLRKNGCALPRTIRSCTCAFHISYNCYDRKKYPFLEYMIREARNLYDSFQFYNCGHKLGELLEWIKQIQKSD